MLQAIGGCALLAGVDDWRDKPATSSSSGVPVGGSDGVGGEGGLGAAGGMGGELVDPNEHCGDDLLNGLETDVDCGGDSCPPCPLGATCTYDFDCKDLLCDGGFCAVAPFPAPCNEIDPQNPTCADCEQNGLESDVDCGGDACAPCAMGDSCATDIDCETGHCDGSSCTPAPGGCPPLDPENPNCADCALNGLETGIDCGGDSCAPCGPGVGCLVDGDCVTLSCVSGSCAAMAPPPECPLELDATNPTCADCAANGSETDVDCGGDACPPCTGGATCEVNGDCVSEVCDSGVCD
jgi:hypothetical protein